jgi:hypothetical protein
MDTTFASEQFRVFASFKRRHLLAVLALLGALSPTFVNAWVPLPNQSKAAPDDCPVVYQGQLGEQGQLKKTYKSTAECGRDGSRVGTYAGRASSTRQQVQPDGASCTLFYNASVTFQDSPTYMTASWSPPNGGSKQLRIDPNSNGNTISTSAVAVSKSSVYSVYSRDGTYQNNECQAKTGWQSYCREGRPTDDPCTFTEPYPLTRAQSPPPPVAPYLDKVKGELQAAAGTISSMPNPRGIVNLPTCFWMDGMTIPDEQDYSLVLAGPPDPSGRQIFYTYLIRLFFAGIEWNFDDPLGNAEVQPHPACGQHPQLTAHNYQLISEKRGNDDGKYHITARENYQLTVDMYWSDSYTTHHEPVDPGIPLPITVSPLGAYPQFVGQVEGIPVS